MSRALIRAVVLTAICCSVSRSATADEAALKAFVAAHCVDCHGPDESKAGLRLDTLALDLSDAPSEALWVRVHDKLAAGEMPPPEVARPPKAETAAVVKQLHDQLHAASLDRQRRQGRVALRRLNGTEYENTIRDLLQTDVKLKELLPEDNAAAGFDNIASALEVSATHQLMYQEAADRAVASVIPAQPPVKHFERRTGLDMTKRGPNFQQTLTRSCKLDGEALVIYSKLPRYGLASTGSVPMAGRYRVRMLIAAVGAAKKSVPAALMVVESSGREDAVVRDFIDVEPGEPKTIEFEFDLKRRQQFVVNYLVTWDIRAFKRPIEEYDGPGLKLDWIEIEGPIGEFPSASYKTLFDGVPLKARSVVKAEMEGGRIPTISENRNEYSWANDPLVPASSQPKEDAERLIRRFLPRAFRRPVDEPLVRHFVDMVNTKLDEKYAFVDAMTYGYKAILSSPHFLMFAEPGAAPPSAVAADLPSTKLDDFALANRLSYFLWSTLPDEELLNVAARGELTKPEVLRAQVERMLSDSRSSRFTDNFTGQWLDLRKIDATIPDPQLYAEFDGTLLWAMPRETKLFFEEVLRHDRSVLEFVDSDWTMLNERLARHYKIEGVEGNTLRKVTLPADSHRGGVMTQAAVMKVTADGTRTSPVLRGKWVLERIVGKPPAPPPPDVPAIEPDIRGAVTIRQQLDKHRNIAACASCHVHIDPPGFALECFDPIGGYREFYRASTRTERGIVKITENTNRAVYRGPDVEQGGRTHDGREFTTVDDYQNILLDDPDQIARNLTQKLLIYATGADLQFADREVVEQIVDAVKKKNYGFRSLLHEVVSSRLFLNK